MRLFINGFGLFFGEHHFRRAPNLREAKKKRTFQNQPNYPGWMERCNEWAEQAHKLHLWFILQHRTPEAKHFLCFFVSSHLRIDISSYMRFDSCKTPSLKIVKHPELSAFLCVFFLSLVAPLFGVVFAFYTHTFGRALWIHVDLFRLLVALSHVDCRRFLCFDTVH